MTISSLSSAEERRAATMSQPLDQARRTLKTWAQENARRRGAWVPAMLPENWQSPRLGAFGPRADWDEPSMASGPLAQAQTFPHMEGDAIVFKRCRPSDLRSHASLKVLEAPADAPALNPDVLLVPCLCADRQGRRIGRGGGFYDRYLSRNPAARAVGVIHSDYLFDRLPDAWLKASDRPMAALLTESELIEIEPRRPTT